MKRAILGLCLSFVVGAPLASLAATPTAQEACAEGPEGLECKTAQPLDRAFVEGVVGPPQGPPLAGEALAQRAHEVGLLLRCPVCQGTSVSDSPSSTAINMKQEVTDLLAEGYTETQILAYFEAAYGQFVLLRPKSEGIGMLVWGAPVLLLGAGAFVVAAALRRLRGSPAADEPGAGSAAEEAMRAAEAEPFSRGKLPEDEELARWVRRVRELAYGWPGGVPPKETP